MGYMISLPFAASKQGNKTSIVVVGTIAAATEGDVALYAGDSVALHRQVEILEGWRWLLNGLRDRNLIDGEMEITDDSIYSASGIDHLNENERVTDWGDGVGFPLITATRIGIGMSTSAQKAAGMGVQLENAIMMLHDWARETGFAIPA